MVSRGFSRYCGVNLSNTGCQSPINYFGAINLGVMNVRRPNKNQVRVARQLRATLSGQEQASSVGQEQASSAGQDNVSAPNRRAVSAKLQDSQPLQRALLKEERGTPPTFSPEKPERLEPKVIRKKTQLSGNQETKTSANTLKSERSSQMSEKWERVSVTQTKKAKFSKRFIAVLATVLISVAVVAPTMNSYIQQQEDKRKINAAIAEQQELQEALELEKQLWGDSQYVQSQARQRLGFVMPGQVLYKVLNSELSGNQTSAERIEEVISQRLAATPFFVSLWHSLELAGTQGEISNPGQTPLVEDQTGTETDTTN